jgi:hypothetical protein
LDYNFEIVVKAHAPSQVVKSKRPKGQKAEDHKDVRAILDLHKRTIRETRIGNNLYRELGRLRDTFLQYGLADKSEANRKFFDKWLADLVVEMGRTPGGGWTSQRVSHLRADLEALRA